MRIEASRGFFGDFRQGTRKTTGFGAAAHDGPHAVQQ
jgi:hypothetical protein